ncbi:glycosyltransferase [Lysinimonas soli]|uniref:D-inositol 3-phosphate glycosyltransferase n=1 Tax=Lysinimonas soli TaxID=1074233 RepID=A0ABW0NTV8_9MICO
MRVLFIHEVSYENKVIYEMHEFPELLALRGHDVTFLQFPEGSGRARRSAASDTREISGRAYRDARLRLVTPPTWGGSTLERFVAPIIDVPTIRREIRSGRYDLVVLYAVPTTGWQAVSIARRAGVPVVFRALDVSHKIRNTIVSRLVLAAERFVYRNATLLSANNPAMGEYCSSISGRTGPVVVNLPPLDLSHFAREPRTDLRAELGLDSSHRVIVYMGSFFSFSGLDIVVRGLAAEFAARPELRLVLVGGGELDEVLRATVDELGLTERVIFTGIIDYQDLPEYLRIGDVAINPFEPELLTNVALPHKVLQYMAAGVPAVSTSLSGLRGVLGEESGITWVSGPEQLAAVASSLAAGDPADLARISRTERQFAQATFSKESAIESFERTLESVIR